MAKLKTTTDSNRKINGNTFLLIITIALFAIMYIAGMVISQIRVLQNHRCF